MNNLAAVLSYLVTTIQRSGYCNTVRVIETHHFSERQFALKLRAELISGDVLQVRIYRNGDHTDYSYQLLRNTLALLRWDNKEHFPDIATHPHHFHAPSGSIEASPLTGDVAVDLPLVLDILFAQS